MSNVQIIAVVCGNVTNCKLDEIENSKFEKQALWYFQKIWYFIERGRKYS